MAFIQGGFQWWNTFLKHVGRAGLQSCQSYAGDRRPKTFIYGVVTGAPNVMPTWFGSLKQCQSRVMVLIELGEISTWVLMLVTKYRRPRGDEKAAILELTDDSSIKHPDTIELPDATIRQYSSAGDLVRANEELKSAGPEDEEEDAEDDGDGGGGGGTGFAAEPPRTKKCASSTTPPIGRMPSARRRNT